VCNIPYFECIWYINLKNVSIPSKNIVNKKKILKTKVESTGTFIIIIRGILVLFMYITKLATNETFSQSNKIHWEVGRAKDLSAPRYKN
jgi:hypothetical protein